MLFRQIIHEDLGCASYLVADRESGVAVVVDPQWESSHTAAWPACTACGSATSWRPTTTPTTSPDTAGWCGKPARRSTSTSWPEAEYAHEPFADGWELTLGELTVEAIHTPGHRPEHTCFLLSDASRGGAPWALSAGDSLFIGDVARPDLAIEPREAPPKCSTRCTSGC